MTLEKIICSEKVSWLTQEPMPHGVVRTQKDSIYYRIFYSFL